MHEVIKNEWDNMQLLYVFQTALCIGRENNIPGLLWTLYLSESKIKTAGCKNLQELYTEKA